MNCLGGLMMWQIVFAILVNIKYAFAIENQSMNCQEIYNETLELRADREYYSTILTRIRADKRALSGSRIMNISLDLKSDLERFKTEYEILFNITLKQKINEKRRKRITAYKLINKITNMEFIDDISPGCNDSVIKDIKVLLETCYYEANFHKSFESAILEPQDINNMLDLCVKCGKNCEGEKTIIQDLINSTLKISEMIKKLGLTDFPLLEKCMVETALNMKLVESITAKDISGAEYESNYWKWLIVFLSIIITLLTISATFILCRRFIKNKK